LSTITHAGISKVVSPGGWEDPPDLEGRPPVVRFRPPLRSSPGQAWAPGGCWPVSAW